MNRVPERSFDTVRHSSGAHHRGHHRHVGAALPAVTVFRLKPRE